MRVAHSTPLNRTYEVLYARCVHLVWSYDKAYRGVVVGKLYEQLLVGCPRRACNEESVIALETLDKLYAFRALGDGCHAVKACVARHNNIGVAYRGEKLARLVVLYKQLIECAEGYVSVRFTSHEYLGGAHGSSSVFGVVFDEKSGDTVSAEDLLGVSEDELDVLLRNELIAMIEAEPEKFYTDAAELIDTALFAMGTFYLDGTELVFTVPEYEIAPYVSGIQYVRIPIAS